MDFTKEMQFNDNAKVNELCECSASQLTYSRRTDTSRHEQDCPYRQFIEKRRAELFGPTH